MRCTDHRHQAEERDDSQAVAGDEGHEVDKGSDHRAYKMRRVQIHVNRQVTER